MNLRIAVVGCGGIASGYHGPALALYAAQHPGTQLLVCCDVNEDRARDFAQRYKFAHHATDLVRMLEQHRPDAVCLFVPEQFTCEIACRVMEMGFPLLLEKPPGRTTEEIDRMIAAAERSGVLVHVAFNRRHMPLVALLKQQLAAHVPPAEIHHIRYEFSRWNRRDVDFSLTAIHGIDAVAHIASSPYQTVRFHYQPLPQLGEGVANIHLDCTMASGAGASLSFCPVAGVVVERATVHARDHSFFVSLPVWNSFDRPGRLQHFHRDKLAEEVSGESLVPSGADCEVGGFYAEDATFLDAVCAQHTGDELLRTARQSVAIAQAMRQRSNEYVTT